MKFMRIKAWLMYIVMGMTGVALSTESPVNGFSPVLFVGNCPASLLENQMCLGSWNVAQDAYLKTYYRNVIPLQTRVKVKEVNGDFSLNPFMLFSASKTSVQWVSNGVDTNHLFWDWNLVGDYFVYFGGSDSEGQLVIPPPGWIQSAHSHGVPIYATIFFSPTGPGVWVDSFFEKTMEGIFPYADTLVALAQAYQLDGFFINQESRGVITSMETIQEFFVYFSAKSEQKIHLVWYDLNMYPDADVLNPTMDLFVNYGAESSAPQWVELAKKQNVPIQNLSFGIDIDQGSNTFSSVSYLMKDVMEASTLCSCSLFDLAAVVNQGQSVPPDLITSIGLMKNFYEGATSTSCVSTTVSSYSAIQGTKFSSSFMMGQGNAFYSKGSLVSDQSWSDPGLQDMALRPQWFIPEQPVTTLQANYSTEQVFTGGTSLSWSGSLLPKQHATYVLYKTDLTLSANAQLEFAYMGGGEGVSIILENSSGKIVKKLIPDMTQTWKRVSIPLVEAMDIMAIKVNFYNRKTTVNEWTFSLGWIALGTPLSPVMAPSGFGVWGEVEEANTPITLLWDSVADAVAYEIRTFAGGESTFVARTSGVAYTFTPSISPIKVGVASVGYDGTLSPYSYLEIEPGWEIIQAIKEAMETHS
jgi:endo-beta-N-acetylglucosaminidase D